jgi:predicted CXXCH cytochrome family protein
MKKLAIIAVAVAVALVWSIPAMAAITGTAHEISGVAGGACAACHIPHASGGDRLWVENPVSGTAPTEYGSKAVSPLCGYCHYSNMGGNTGAAWSSSNVYGPQSHGHANLMNGDSEPYGHEASGLPYMADAADGDIECTTCHNVHDDSERPFLRLDVNVLCGACHGSRLHLGAGGWESYTVATAPTMGAWGASLGAANPGSHPVGTDILGDTGDASKPVTIPNIMRVATTTGPTNWTLGGHLTDGSTSQTTGGVICVTCHAVHGIQYDSGFTTSGLDSGGADNTAPYVNFLAVEQASVTIAPLNRSVANGQGEANYLCEACHTGTAPAGAYNHSATNSSAPNPGATAYGHPVDDMSVINTGNWVSAFPTSWPSGPGYTASDSDPNVICQSCHGVHIAADAARDDYTSGVPSASTYMLRNSNSAICGDCHQAAPGHHPIGDTFNGNGADYLTNVAAGAGNVLSCSTCHSEDGAHNWTGAGAVGIDPNWKPTDNARAATYDTDMSKTCMDCHYNITGTTRYSPLLQDSSGMEAEAGYEDHGDASHYIGVINLRSNYTLGSGNSNYWLATDTTGLGGKINPQTTAWGAAQGGVGGYSRFGGTAATPVVVCESCHELEPDKSNATHLLLGQVFTDQANGAMARTTDLFCEGCHLPKGTHPLTGDTVGRTGSAVATDLGATIPWLQSPSASGTTGPAMGSAAQDTMSCDSCHQVHDAPDKSRTFILDVDPAYLSTNGQTLTNGTTSDYSTSYVTPADAKGANMLNYQGFCDKCHPYE